MEKALTVIVPTYNMERYLGECLASMVTERSPELLEVVVVNDGSTDGSSAIAHRFAEQHPTLFKVIDKENGHYGSCINEALKYATGKYFRPLDADDWVNTDSLIKLLEKLSTCTADLVITEICVYKKRGKDYHTIPNVLGALTSIG